MRSRVVAQLLTLAVAAAALLGTQHSPTVDGRSFVIDEDVPAVFWQGPPTSEADCGPDCWSYVVDVTEPGFRVRAGVDRPTLGNVWTIRLYRPDGSYVGAASPGSQLYSAEVVDNAPQVGRYEVQVVGDDVEEYRYRARVGLDQDDLLPSGTHEFPPDLVALPPWDLSFKYPVTNGLTGDSIGYTLPTGRVACHPEEVALYAAVRCLRMSYGVANIGQGPLELYVGPGVEFTDRPLTQRVRRANGSYYDRPAGNAYFHHSHLHYHHDFAIGLDLLKVVDVEEGLLAPAGAPQRKGFAHRNELLRDWDTFYSIWPRRGIGLVPGWGDYYEWDRPGNYIDMGLNEDGLYVARMTADPDGYILDADPSNNVAYSYFRVTGETVEHLESGRGTDPWDPCRTPLPLGAEFEDSFTRSEPLPEDC